MKSHYVAFFLITTNILAIRETKENITIGIMGDVMLGRTVNEKIGQTSYEYPWGDFRVVLAKNDINLANLECTLTSSTCMVPKVFNFRARPDRVHSLKAGSVTVVSLANNHIFDYCSAGLTETINTLDLNNILHTGAGKTTAQAQQPAIITKKGLIVGIIGATDNEPGWQAGSKKAGTNFFYPKKPSYLIQQILQLRPLVDVLIVSLHWGPNFVEKPSRLFQDLAHRMVEAGADIIHGHSAHIIQPIEFYKDKLILYDTGDFIDDYAVDQVKRNDETCLFLVTIGKRGIETVRIVPGMIQNMQVNRAKNKDSARIIDKINRISREFGTTIIHTHGQYFVKKFEMA